MAALSSCKFHDLAERIASFWRPAGRGSRRQRSVARPPAVLFDPGANATGEQIDSLWLARAELRSSSEAADHLERSGFRARTRTVTALFVDSRCGLICSEFIDASVLVSPGEIMRRILGVASRCHAHGIIIATNDPDGEIASSVEWRELTTVLSRKAEATGVSLLNHLVLTTEGWKTIAPEPCDRPAAVVQDHVAPPDLGSSDVPFRIRSNPRPHGGERKVSGVPFAGRQSARD